MRTDKRALGIAMGSLCGLSLFALTLRNTIRGTSGDHLNLLKGFYFGYDSSLLGAFVGLVWAFVSGFVFAWVFGWLYEKLARPEAS